MAAGDIIPEKRPDFDNLAKTAADALQGVAFRNDSQIADAVIRKRYSSTPRMRIQIQVLGEAVKLRQAEQQIFNEQDIARSQSRLIARSAQTLERKAVER
jgi:hypothetical protein